MIRATWADFVRWAAEQCAWEATTNRLYRPELAARITTRGEAMAVLAACPDPGVPDIDAAVEKWLIALRDRGIEPPMESSMLASVLESVALDLELTADRVESFVAQLRRSGREAKASYNSGRHEAYRDAIRILRARAKEAT